MNGNIQAEGRIEGLRLVGEVARSAVKQGEGGLRA
jgi:hypothetical protein